MKLYIADQHFYYDVCNRDLDGRGFKTIFDMNNYMIDRWNSKVKGGDMVIVLGDLCWSREPSEVNNILHRLKGKIALIEGNHDYLWLKKEGVDLGRFEWIKPYAELADGDNKVIASHYPMPCYNHQYQINEDGSPVTYMLYGHVHNSQDEKLIQQFQDITRKTIYNHHGEEMRTIPCNMINCFCMFSDYQPLSLQEWISVDKKRRENIDRTN